MKLLEKILVPTDFHGSADRSVEMAIDLAKRFNSEIILLHILTDNPDLSEFEDIIKMEVDRQLKSILSKMNDSGVENVSTVKKRGIKFNEINELAEEQDINLIIMGSGERGSKDQSRLGTTTKRVIESSTKPVWVMTEDATDTIKTIVCPVDFSAPSHRALRNAIHLARHFKARLTVLTVDESFTDLLDGLELDLKSESDQASEKIQDELDQFLKEFDFHNVEWDKKVYQGKPHVEILKAIEGQENETLLIMGTTGRTGLSKLLVGSVTEKVTAQLPCSFITMKEEEFIELRLDSQLNELETHYKQGIELLKNGLPKEALNQFKLCLNINDLHAPSWDGTALAYGRLHEIDKEEECTKRAKEIRTRMEEQKIVAEIRSRHWLARKR